ncbi:hypothetical protein GCM10028819_32360 [Spirosoma humi]
MAKPESYKQFQTAQEKYTYFLLTAAGSAIVFTIQKTDGRCFEWALLPLGLAILAWGLSFFFGCRHVTKKMESLQVDIGLEEYFEGYEKPKRGDIGISLTDGRNPEYELTARRLVNDLFDEAAKFSQLQFKFMIAGIVFYVTWYLLEMSLRTYQVNS